MLNKLHHIRLLLLFALIFFLFSPGCSTVEERDRASDQYKGQVTLFLKGIDNTINDITFELTAIHAVSDKGAAVELLKAPVSINSIALTGRQILLGENVLPEGKYRKLQLVIKKASISREGKTTQLALPPESIEIPVNIYVVRQQNTPLFLTWNSDASFLDGYLFRPVIDIKAQAPELSTSLIYVTNEASDNVSVINRYSGETVATVMVGKKPRGITVSQGKDNLRVYVANAGSNSISVIDPTKNQVESEIPVRFGNEPEGITAVRVSYKKELVFVTNYNSNSVSVIDPVTFQEVEKIDVGKGPVAVAADPPVEDLVSTRFLSFDEINLIKNYRQKYFNVYVVNYHSNEVSVLIMDMRTNRCKEVVTVNVSWSPVALAVDYQKGKVYVANYNSDNLSVIDIVQIIKGNTKSSVSAINNLGRSIIGIIAEPVFDRWYLLREQPGEVVILRSLSEFDVNKTVMPPVMGTIPVGEAPRSFALDPENRKLYVVNRRSDNISVIDRTAKIEEQTIPVGKKPYGIAMFQR